MIYDAYSDPTTASTTSESLVSRSPVAQKTHVPSRDALEIGLAQLTTEASSKQHEHSPEKLDAISPVERLKKEESYFHDIVPTTWELGHTHCTLP